MDNRVLIRLMDNKLTANKQLTANKRHTGSKRHTVRLLLRVTPRQDNKLMVHNSQRQQHTDKQAGLSHKQQRLAVMLNQQPPVVRRQRLTDKRQRDRQPDMGPPKPPAPPKEPCNGLHL